MSMNAGKQEELIREYCSKAEALLAKASDYGTALYLKEQLCSRFEKECESSLVVAAARLHIDGILKKRWHGEGRETHTSVDRD
jgi:hypothetical protein